MTAASRKSDSLIDTFVSRSPKSRGYYERASKVIPSGSNRAVVFYRPYPVYSKRAKGSRIWDIDDVERIDYCFNYSSLVLGHANPAVVAAIAAELENGLARGQPTILEVELAETVTKMIPSAEMVKLTVTGTEAVMNAARSARAYTRKDDIVVFEGAYHGTSDMVSANGLSFRSHGIPEDAQRHTIVVPFNDPDALQRALSRNRNVAAVLMEPFLASGGTVVPDEDFTKAVRETTEKTGVLLILDEIITGFRIGKGGWQEKYRIKPDMTILGKNVAGGMPGAAVCGSKEILEDVYAFPDSETLELKPPKTPLSGTYNAFPLSLAAGLATLRQLSPEVFEKINGTASSLAKGFMNIANDLKIDVRAPTAGSVFQFHFTIKDIVDTKTVKLADAEMRRRLDLALLNEGVYLSPGHFCCTSSATTNADVKQTLGSIEKAFNEVREIARAVPTLAS
jgi:glutamate-1-semialdehyde 2,1-aminomutase